MNGTKAIRDSLNRTDTITAMLDVYEGEPAVFDDQAPDDYLAKQAKACIILAVPTRNENVGTLTEEIWAQTRDVRIYARRSGSAADIDILAGLVRDLFHLRPEEIEVEGGKCTISTASAPLGAPTTDSELVGRRISLNLELQQDYPWFL